MSRRSAASRASDPEARVRQRILVAAETRFLTLGVSGVTMDDLAASLGMSKKTVYGCYPSKEALLSAMIEGRLDRIRSGLQRIVGKQGLRFPEKLAQVVQFMAERFAEVKPPFVHDLRRQVPELFARIEAVRQEVLPEVFGRLLEEGRREGMVRPEMDPRLTTVWLGVLLHEVVNPEAVTRLGLTLQSAFDGVLGILFTGIMTSNGRRVYERIRQG